MFGQFGNRNFPIVSAKRPLNVLDSPNDYSPTVGVTESVSETKIEVKANKPRRNWAGKPKSAKPDR